MTERMTLGGYLRRFEGNAPPRNRHEWLSFYAAGSHHWPQPYDRFFERIGYRRYSAGPRPWAPGRYRTSMWQPGGYGRFSEITDRLRGAYHAERYTGVRLRPEDYWKTHGQPGEYERNMDREHRKRSWRMAV